MLQCPSSGFVIILACCAVFRLLVGSKRDFAYLSAGQSRCHLFSLPFWAVVSMCLEHLCFRCHHDKAREFLFRVLAMYFKNVKTDKTYFSIEAIIKPVNLAYAYETFLQPPTPLSSRYPHALASPQQRRQRILKSTYMVEWVKVGET